MIICKRSDPSDDHLQLFLLLLNDCELDESGIWDDYGESGLKKENRLLEE